MLLGLSVLAFSIFYSVSVFAAGPGSNPCSGSLFCLADAFNTSGSESVVVCAGTSTPMNWFNFWYNGTGPLNSSLVSNGTASAQFYFLGNSTTSGTSYNNNPLTNATNPPCVKFDLNATVAPFTNKTIQINVTAENNTDYLVASTPPNCGISGCNGTMFTINYVSIESQNIGGIAVPNAVFMTYNNATKTFLNQGPALTDSSGYWAEHCSGIVVSGNCLNSTPPNLPNICFVHGIPFPEQTNQCAINTTASLRAFDFISSNASAVTNVTVPSTAGATVLSLNSITAMGFVMPNGFSPSPGMSGFLNVTNLNVTDSSGQLVYQSQPQGGGQGPEGGPPFFLTPNSKYTITVSIQGSGTYSYPFMAPSKGMTGAQITIPNASTTDYTTFIGKIVNSSNSPIPGAIVYAQFYKGGGGSFGISFFNSSVTDNNGLFSIKVPTTQWISMGGGGGGGLSPYPVYQFYIISNQTNSSNSVPIYFPTIDNNNNRGYFAQPAGGTSVLPALNLKAGGQVNVNVTLNGASLVLGELSKFLSLGTGLTRSDVTGKFTMISIFSGVTLPSSIVIPFLAPINSVAGNLYGKNQSFGGPGSDTGIISGCFNSTIVNQGLISQINCNLTQPGYLNLTVTTCSNIFDQSTCTQQEQAGNFGFWFDTNGILRDVSGNAVSYISPDGTVLQDLLGFGSNPTQNITMPLPNGTYTLELVPGFEFSSFTGVYNGTTFDITPGATTNLKMVRGNSWIINPMFNPSLTLTGNNPLNISVFSPNGVLNATYVNLNGSKVLFLNKSVASNQAISFGFDPNGFGGGAFYNTTFNPSALGLSAGKYWLLINATNVTGTARFTTTMLMPINAYDFQVGVDMGGFTFGTGQNVFAKVFAYNTSSFPPIGLNASSGNVTLKVYDSTGAQISVTSAASSVVNGQGSVNITMPSSLGFYEIVTSVQTDGCISAGCVNGTTGVADNWVQVSNVNIKSITDKTEYKPTDSVALTVQVLNSTGNTPISGASVQVSVDNGNTPAVGVTGGDGKVAITLDPQTYGTNNQWSFGFHNLQIKISKSTASDVINFNTFSDFDVRGLNLFVRSSKPSYSQGENVSLDVFGPSGFTIGNVVVDGSTLTECMTPNCAVGGSTFGLSSVGPGYIQISLANWTIGHHDVKVPASFGGGTQNFYTGFDISAYSIIATTDSFSYSVNQNITLLVSANYPNGTSVSNQNVIATLFKAQPPNDINVTQVSGTTNSSGQVALALNATQPGFNYIKVNVGGQLQYVGVQVSTLKVSLLSSSGSLVTNYNAAPGDTLTIYVNATSGGSNVPDNSQITARIWAFGNPIDLPSNTTTNGNATIIFQIPSFAPAQVYGLELRVTTPTGDQGFAPPASVTITGGSALQLSASADRSFLHPYKPGDTALFSASLTYPNGTAAGGYNVTFEVGSERTTPQTVGTAVTGSGGLATTSYNITTNSTDGPYFLHVYITSSTDVQAYSGFLVSSLTVNATTDKSVYAPGENITLTVTLFNRTSGSQLNATGGFVNIFSKDNGQVNQFFDPTGMAQPYQINVTIPNEADAVGTYPIGVVMFVNQYQGIGFALVDVRNSSLSLNLSLPSTITASSYFLANLSASTGSVATLRVFSPAAASLIYENTSVSLSGTPASASLNLTINNPGVYVFNGFVSGIGGVTQIVSVAPPSSGTIPAIWTGTSTSANATAFTTSQNVYISSNIANSTATVLTVDTTTNTTITYSLPLTLNMTNTYYGIFSSSNLVSGRTYFVRLDTSASSSLATTMFSVS